MVRGTRDGSNEFCQDTIGNKPGGFEMLTRTLGRTAVLASVMAVTLSALAPTQADARPRGWHGGGGLAAAAAIGAIGTGLAIAASRDAYAYDPGPGYYDAGPAYYDAPPAYYGYGGHTAGHYPYQRQGGESPNAACAQGTTWNCQ